MVDGRIVARVRRLTAKILAVDPQTIAADSDLRLCGMDSLKWADLCETLSAEFDVILSMEIDKPTLNEIASQILTQIDSRSNRDFSEGRAITSQPETVRLKTQNPCPEVSLALDDLVPTNILLLIAFRYDASDRLIDGIKQGLEIFPHLAGRLAWAGDPSSATIQADPAGVLVERRSTNKISLPSIGELTREQLVDHFFPSGTSECLRGASQSPLLSVRTTSIQGGSVIGIVASHRVVDGTGLALFLGHCMGGVQHVPIHDRAVLARHLLSDSESRQHSEQPHWYINATSAIEPLGSGMTEWELAQTFPVDVFTIHENELRDLFTGDQSSTWFQLTALLCEECATLNYREAAFWCDVRGSLRIPRTYTGNVGCYWHEKIGLPDESTLNLAKRLRAGTGDRNRIATVYSAVKLAELENRPLRWTGTAQHVLPINLVPHFSSMLNFGGGGPVMTRILTRNVHGIRISRAPRDTGFLVEVCLPEDHVRQLRIKLQDRGVQVSEPMP